MYLIQDEHGQIELAHSISAGLDYPGIGPEHSYYHDIGRVTYECASDEEAMEALVRFTKIEGIIPAIESAHALSYVEKLAPKMKQNDILVVTISGRGDKDMETIQQYIQQRKEDKMSKIFIPYIMGNRQFLENVKLLDKSGADIIEIGVPFSDPVADGPIIMKAGHEALKDHITIDYIFDELDKHQNEINCKCVLMTYYNVILSYGEKAFFKNAMILVFME